MAAADHHEQTRAALALGSNVGNRESHLRFAVEELGNQPEITVERCSSIYTCEAHVLDGTESRKDYLNAVVIVETSLEPAELLSVCLDIERRRGRIRPETVRWQPRTLDVDILVFGELTLRGAPLTIPHPRMAERRFVLEPLFEIAPDLEIPAPFDHTVQYLLDHCNDTAHVGRYVRMSQETKRNDST